MEKRIKDRVNYLLINLDKGNPLPKNEFDEIVDSFDFELPQYYLDVMRDFNGGEGEVGENSWLCLFEFSELKRINEDYQLLMANITDYLLFGKDAADTGYAFHKVNGTFHSFGLMSNFNTDAVELLGNDFIEFLQYLYNP